MAAIVTVHHARGGPTEATSFDTHGHLVPGSLAYQRERLAAPLLGKWNWYLPRWLDWLPHVEVESHAVPPGAARVASATKP